MHIASQVVGEGPLDLLLIDTWVHHVEAVWDFPDVARFLRRLSSFGRLIHFDRRGTALSDPVPLDQLPDLETQVGDAVAVLRAAGVRWGGRDRPERRHHRGHAAGAQSRGRRALRRAAGPPPALLGPARRLRALLPADDGVHTGEVEVRGADQGGLAVHIAARVAGRAGDGEVLVSSTVKDLLVGSGVAVADRGDHELEGAPGAWRLFAVTPAQPT